MDVELRTLERAALAGGARERLAWARGLERAGRRDEAVAALLPARADPAIRAHVEGLPAWSHPDGDAGRTFFLDAMPVARTPVVRWSTHVPFDQDATLLASPLAIVAEGRSTVHVLDPATGAARELTLTSPFTRYVELRGARLAVWRGNGDEHTIDVLNGEQRWVGSARTFTSVRDRDLVVRFLDGDVIEALSLASDGPRLLWRYPATGTLRGKLAGGTELSVGATRVALWGNSDFALLDRESGAEVGSAPGDFVIVDAVGVVGRRGHSVFACDLAARELWSKGVPAEPPRMAAVTPELVLVRAGQETLAFDRRSGDTMGRVGDALRTHGVVQGRNASTHVARPARSSGRSSSPAPSRRSPRSTTASTSRRSPTRA
jgi:hypothetical protein